VLEALGFWSTLFAILFFVGLVMWWRKKQQMLEANSARNIYRRRMEEIMEEMGDGGGAAAAGVVPGHRPRRWSKAVPRSSNEGEREGLSGASGGGGSFEDGRGGGGGVGVGDAGGEGHGVSLKKKLICYAMPATLLVASVAGIAAVDTKPMLEWVADSGSVAPVLFVLIFAVATVLFIPAIVLTLGAGFVFADAYGRTLGVLVGSAVVFVGASLGSYLSFLLGRTMLRDTVQSMIRGSDLFRAIDRAMEKNGLKFMLLMRLSPLVPFNALNYGAGVMSVTHRDYIIACVGMLPGIVAFVYLGAGMESVSSAAGSDVAEGEHSGGQAKDPTTDIVMWVVGVLFAILAVAAVSKAAKKELNLVLEEDRAYWDARLLIDKPDGHAGPQGLQPARRPSDGQVRMDFAEGFVPERANPMRASLAAQGAVAGATARTAAAAAVPAAAAAAAGAAAAGAGAGASATADARASRESEPTDLELQAWACKLVV
jgi:uncharacterized membrane protein YdjX (TVP38/TMEM64 family)